VVHVTERQPVKISVDALPGETLDGMVSHIKPRSEMKAGDVTYTVEISLSGPGPRLRWGMTTSVQFAAGDSAVLSIASAARITVSGWLPCPRG
jgi:HlyD family secretion protein